MAISYQSTDPSVQYQELKWRSLILRENDAPIVTIGSGAGGFLTTTPQINVQQPVDNVAGLSRPVCIKILGAGGAPATATAVAVSGNVITPTFAVAPVSGDIIMVHYVVTE